MINLEKLSKAELIALQFQITARIRADRIRQVNKTLAKKKKTCAQVNTYYAKLQKEIKADRHIFIDDALDVLELLLGIDE